MSRRKAPPKLPVYSVDVIESVKLGLSRNYEAILREALATNCDYAAMATNLSIPIGTVRSRLHRARRGVEAALERMKAAPSSTPKFDAMTPDQQRHCEFMGFDPDNPDVPLG